MTTFEIINSTGQKNLILRYKKDCECKKGTSFVPVKEDYSDIESIDKTLENSYNSFLKAFSNLSSSKVSYCDKCFRIGSLYSPLITEPSRIDINSTPYSTNGNILDSNFAPINNKSYCVFLDDKYSFVTNSDLFCLLDSGSNVTSVFKIIGKESFSYNNFTYWKLTITNILNSSLIGVGVSDYVLRASK